MKKRISQLLVFAVSTFLVAITLPGCSCEHQWKDATCTKLQTCSLCGETQGDFAAHSWVDATCIVPKTCSVCNFAEGSVSAHTWEIATCSTPKICSLCNETEGEALGHKWIDATCTNPMVCSVCAEVAGNAMGHAWADATCTDPSICKTCNITNGKALGHSVDDWNEITASTCVEAGVEEGPCTVCGETVERALNLIDHTPSDWIVTVEPTENADGTHVKKCTYCDVELECEKFAMSSEEIKARYKGRCRRISYSDLARSPDKYTGEYVVFTGKVVQVCSEADSALYYSTYRVATSGSYGDVVYIYVDNYGSGERILEDDWITFYGKSDGLYSYTTVRGDRLSIPSIKVEYVD